MVLMLCGCHVGANVILHILRKEFESSGLGNNVDQEGNEIIDGDSTMEDEGEGDVGSNEHEEGVNEEEASMEVAHDAPEVAEIQTNHQITNRRATFMEYVDENVPPTVNEDVDLPQHRLLNGSSIHAHINRWIENGWMTGETVERDLRYSPYPYVSSFYSGYS
ncbi:hypothetical protein NEOLEDRAFT_1243105 [Neolentinus lepideus HHB14362 ss-1]|uniref:Uncharacterized protein n=1 Tax=Neolentinus lepideus HHB14362 ss-1 TaxID=1314782 RepID=A0A165R9V0_9AGAM|nr:hypothetical protein NEOLEDRAFT_1243105 [Neolentinus lepideus HHB14362 ss-1]